MLNVQRPKDASSTKIQLSINELESHIKSAVSSALFDTSSGLLKPNEASVYAKKSTRTLRRWEIKGLLTGVEVTEM